jgi:hypothetical protein
VEEGADMDDLLVGDNLVIPSMEVGNPFVEGL